MGEFVGMDRDAPRSGAGAAAGPARGPPASRHNELIDGCCRRQVAKPEDLVVVLHLDLLAGGNHSTLSGEARELAEAVTESDSVPWPSQTVAVRTRGAGRPVRGAAGDRELPRSSTADGDWGARRAGAGHQAGGPDC